MILPRAACGTAKRGRAGLRLVAQMAASTKMGRRTRNSRAASRVLLSRCPGDPWSGVGALWPCARLTWYSIALRSAWVRPGPDAKGAASAVTSLRVPDQRRSRRVSRCPRQDER